MPETDVATVSFGLQQERAFVEALRALGFTVSTSSYLDSLLKTDACILGDSAGLFSSPVYVQFTTILDYLPKMETFERLRERRAERGIYVECAESDPVATAEYVVQHVLSRLSVPTRHDDSVLFVHMHGRVGTSRTLLSAIERLHNKLDAKGVRTDRLHGTVTSFAANSSTLIATVRGDDGTDYLCNLKSCTHLGLYTYLAAARRHPHDMLAWRVQVSFFPHLDYQQVKRGFGLRFSDDAHGAWLLRVWREISLHSRLTRQYPGERPAHIERLFMASRLVMNDLLYTAQQARYHLPQFISLSS